MPALLRDLGSYCHCKMEYGITLGYKHPGIATALHIEVLVGDGDYITAITLSNIVGRPSLTYLPTVR